MVSDSSGPATRCPNRPGVANPRSLCVVEARHRLGIYESQSPCVAATDTMPTGVARPILEWPASHVQPYLDRALTHGEAGRESWVKPPCQILASQRDCWIMSLTSYTMYDAHSIIAALYSLPQGWTIGPHPPGNPTQTDSAFIESEQLTRFHPLQTAAYQSDFLSDSSPDATAC